MNIEVFCVVLSSQKTTMACHVFKHEKRFLKFLQNVVKHVFITQFLNGLTLALERKPITYTSISLIFKT